MSKTPNRVESLYQHLAIEERIRLVYESMIEERDEDPEIRLSLPDSQRADFSRKLGEIIALNRVVGTCSSHLQLFSETIWLRVLTSRVFQLRNPVTANEEISENVEETEYDAIEDNKLAINMIRRDLIAAWSDMLELEVVFSEILGSLGVTDIPHPRITGLLKTTRKNLEMTNYFLSTFFAEMVQLPTAPPEESLNELRRLVGEHSISSRSTSKADTILSTEAIQAIMDRHFQTEPSSS